MPTLEEAIEQIRMGNKDEGRQLLEEILEEDENNEEVWLWLSSVVDTDEDREICLENVLALNANNVVAQRGLEALQSGTFNINELFGDVLEEEPEEIETTFLDEFISADDEVGELGELEYLDTTTRAKKKSGGLNIKVIILAVLILVLILVLAGLGAAYFFLIAGGGDTTPVETPSGQETPVEAPGSGPAPTETPTPTPAPTNTPTATFTPALKLPTPAPTNTPSPVPTQVVSPTPSDG